MRVRVSVLCAALAALWASAPGSARAQAGPRFDATVLELTPEMLDRFGKALQAEESSRKAIAASAAAPVAKATKSKQEYDNCQMQLAMSPEFQETMSEFSKAMGGGGDPAAMQKAAATMQAKMDALLVKSCGPDPSKTARKPDVGGQMRTAQSEAAKANSFTDRQYAMVKERVTPLCLADPVTNDSAGVRIRGDGNVFWVYTSDEVEALKPHCDEFMKLIVHPKP